MFARPALAVALTAAIVGLPACTVRTPEEPTGPGSTDAAALSADRPGNAMVTIPIGGTWDNTESPPDPAPPAGCIVHIQTSQVGNASHLGRFTGRGSTCVTTREMTDSPPFWDHEPAPPYAVMQFTNQMVWTAANGDELWLNPNGGVFVMSLSIGAASVRGSLNVAGGTGRFEDASGSLDVTGGREPGEPGDHLRYNGRISLKPGL